jgi:hypothetical protein
MHQADILRVVVASPSDVQAERDALSGVVDELNHGIARDRGLQLSITRWEDDAYAGFHRYLYWNLLEAFRHARVQCGLRDGARIPLCVRCLAAAVSLPHHDVLQSKVIHPENEGGSRAMGSRIGVPRRLS